MSYQDQIINFNADKRVIQLREKYNEPTFFEIISKERSETTYSSFLKWMFQNSVSLENDINPFLLFLDVIVKKDIKNVIDEEWKIALISRSKKVINLTAEVEKSVSCLAEEATQLQCIKKEKKSEFEKICQDRVDLFINCVMEDRSSLQVILENKIDSVQGSGKNNKRTGIKEYDNACQTTRYFMGTKRKYEQKKIFYQIYVYLTPEDNNLKGIDSNFICITYQDLLAGVVAPLMVSSSLSERARFFLEEFNNQLTYPSLNDKKISKSLALAIGEEQTNIFDELWENYSQLIIDSILLQTNTTIWEYNNNWSIEFPREEAAKNIVAAGGEQEKKKYIKNNNFGKNIPENSILKDMEQFNLDIKKITYKSNANKDIKEKDKSLLNSFLNNNKKILMAILSGIKSDNKRKPILLEELSKI